MPNDLHFVVASVDPDRRPEAGQPLHSFHLLSSSFGCLDGVFTCVERHAVNQNQRALHQEAESHTFHAPQPTPSQQLPDIMLREQ